MENWLNNKVNDKYLGQYDMNSSVMIYDSKYDKVVYYEVGDSDMLAIDKNDVGQEDYEIYKYDDSLFIYPNTNRYHANLLFRQMIDFSIGNNMTFLVKSGKDNDVLNIDLLGSQMKEAFYGFCFDNTWHG
jgi:hypothetical protein